MNTSKAVCAVQGSGALDQARKRVLAQIEIEILARVAESAEATLFRLAQAADVFVSASGGLAYASVPLLIERPTAAAMVRRTFPVSSSEFRRWLLRSFKDATGSAPPKDAVARVIEMLEARAAVGLERPVYGRVGSARNGNLYIDLGAGDGRVVEITPRRWRIRASSPVEFVSHRNMGALPVPERGGGLADLRGVVNLPDDGGRSWTLLIGLILTYLRRSGSYPALILQGEQGSAKSTFSKIVRALVDPLRTAPLRNPPKDAQAVIASLASGTHMLAFNNVSYLEPWLSDLLCMVATGDGVGARRFYADDQERVFGDACPILLNGIEQFAARPDLLERSIVMVLPAISTSDRLTEAEVFERFGAIGGRVFGALLDAMVVGLREYSTTRPSDLPRMADTVRWVTACEKSNLWDGPPFADALRESQEEAAEVVFEASSVGGVLEAWIEDALSPEGPLRITPTELLSQLKRLAGQEACRAKGWPRVSTLR